MVKKFRRFMIALCVMTLCFTTCAFAAEAVQSPATDYSEYVKYYAENYAKTYGGASAEELAYMEENSVGVAKKLAEGIYTYAESDSLGALLSLGETTVEKQGDTYKAQIPLTYEKGTMVMSFDMQFLLEDLRVTDVDVSFNSSVDKAPLSEVMKQAGINTVIGISVVFFMLAFMSIIIAQFKHISKLEEVFSGRKAEQTASEGIDNAVTQIVENEASTDDLELVAVIAAAIAASENAPADGFTVRSIRKVRF